MRAALGPAVVIWGFGYILADLLAFLTGRSAPALYLFFSFPTLVLGVVQTLALESFRASQLEAPITRWTGLAVGLVAASVVQSLFDLYWIRWVALALVPSWQEWSLTISPERVVTTAVIYLWTFCLALTVLWAVRVGRAAEANKMRAASAEVAAAQAQAAALRLQLNPHFLFNTLNSISSLVLVDRKPEAEEMITRLCDFLRGSLHSDPLGDVPLSQELEVVEAYLDIEATRFGENLTIEFDISSEVMDALVPNFILQPLVENAIKHGIAKTRNPSKISISGLEHGGDLTLLVCNTLPGEASGGTELDQEGRKRDGIGLANVRERLANRYGAKASLVAEPIGGEFRVTIRFPQVFAAIGAGSRSTE